MITPEDAEKKAVENFKSGLNCTQAVASVFAEESGYDTEMIKALAQPFGGGMCRMREVCGTVSGMMLSLGMIKGKSNGEKSSKDDVYKTGQELAAKFKEINGSIICRELLGLSQPGADNPVSEARSPEYYKKRPCAELCGIAARIFAEYINRE